MLLITGAAGFIGGYCMQHLSKEYNILATDRQELPCPVGSGIQFVRGDIEDGEFLQHLFANNKIDIVLHLAAEKSLVVCENNPGAYRTNVLATLELYKLSRSNGAHFVFLSSDQVFDGKTGDYKEDSLPSPINNYGKYKAEVERRLIGQDGVTICRTALVFGYKINPFSVNFDKSEVVNQSEFVDHVVARLSAGKTIKLSFDEIISPTYVGALYRQLRMVLHKQPLGILHCCGNEAISRFDFGQKIADFLGLNVSGIVGVKGKSYRPKNVSLNVSCSERLLGIKYPSVDEMLKEMIEDEVDND
ncbi:MAG: SDR family oxidoreductase [Eubacterium sp.]|nr:SDR family oxidoreductase [Eubacterium sp.]